MIRFTTTKRKEKVLNHLDFQYTRKRINQSNEDWRCRNRKCTSALALSLDNTRIVREPSAHIESCQPCSIR